MKTSFRTCVGWPALSVVALSCAIVSSPVGADTRLPEAVITANRIPQDPTLLPMGVTVITADEIRASGVSNASDAIRWLGGVATRIDTTGGRNPSLDLRGFGETAGSNLVILVDGVRQNEGDSSGASISWLPIQSIERIEIVRGSGAVVHGEGATAGVINIITGRGEADAGRSVFVGAGSHNTSDVRAELRTVSERWRYQVYGSTYDTDNHRDNFKLRERNALARATWSDGDRILSAQLGAQSQKSGLPGGLSLAQFQANPSQTNKPSDSGNVNSTNLLLSAEMPAGDWRLGLDVNHRNKRVTGDYVTDMYTSANDTASTRSGVKVWRSNEWMGAKGRLLLGMDYEEWSQFQNPSYASTTQIDQQSKAGYARQELTWVAQGLTAVGGIRRTQSSRQAVGNAAGTLEAQNTSWEAGILQKLSNNSQVYARLGTSFRLANADEFSCSYQCPTSLINLLRPQTSRDTEVGYRQRSQAVDWAVRVYRSDLTDEIGVNEVFANVNYDPTRRQGVELEAKAPLSRQVRGAVQVGERRSIFRSGSNVGSTVPYASNHTVTGNLAYDMSATQQWMLMMQWVSSQKISGDLSNTCAQEIPSYGVANLRYSERVAAWTFAGQVNNLLDRQYYDYRSRCSPTSQSIYPQAGRTFMFSASRQF